MSRRKHSTNVDECVGIVVLGVLAVSVAATLGIGNAVVALLCFNIKINLRDFLDFHFNSILSSISIVFVVSFKEVYMHHIFS